MHCGKDHPPLGYQSLAAADWHRPSHIGTRPSRNSQGVSAPCDQLVHGSGQHSKSPSMLRRFRRLAAGRPRCKPLVEPIPQLATIRARRPRQPFPASGNPRKMSRPRDIPDELHKFPKAGCLSRTVDQALSAQINQAVAQIPRSRPLCLCHELRPRGGCVVKRQPARLHAFWSRGSTFRSAAAEKRTS